MEKGAGSGTSKSSAAYCPLLIITAACRRPYTASDTVSYALRRNCCAISPAATALHVDGSVGDHQVSSFSCTQDRLRVVTSVEFDRGRPASRRHSLPPTRRLVRNPCPCGRDRVRNRRTSRHSVDIGHGKLRGVISIRAPPFDRRYSLSRSATIAARSLLYDRLMVV